MYEVAILPAILPFGMLIDPETFLPLKSTPTDGERMSKVACTGAGPLLGRGSGDGELVGMGLGMENSPEIDLPKRSQ